MAYAPFPRKKPRKRIFLFLVLLLLAVAVGVLVGRELMSSDLQAPHLAKLAKDVKFSVEPGVSPSIRFPTTGPYDERLGYARLPDFIGRLTNNGFEVERQARFSSRLVELTDFGLFPAYREKTQAGLTVYDCNDQPIYATRHPERQYSSFEAIPRVLVESLLFIENRELLDSRYPHRNPALQGARLGRAVLDKMIQLVYPSHSVPGGSTLATQIEKYRHSADGQTLTVKDKLRQMASASVRAYLGGEDTLAARRQIVLDYLNSVPLAAAPGVGEVYGIGDGLWAWFGLDFDTVNEAVGAITPESGGAQAAALYKRALSLLISQRRPSFYLGSDHEELEALTDTYLGLMADAGVISGAVRDAALKAKLDFVETRAAGEAPSFVAHKATTAVRTRLSSLLGVNRLYDLDRLDLSAKSTLHTETQSAVTEILQQLKDPDYAKAAGLYGERLLNQADPSRVIYSLNLYELGAHGALARVQADNLDQPFDINQGTKLDLGSTAKLRTLVNYLQIVSRLHERLSPLSRDELRKLAVDRHDRLTQWAVEYLSGAPDKSLMPMLEAAMARKYSASPGEAFATGGGLLTFANFQKEDDGKILDLWDATRNSVNLVFIRLMRDIVRYYEFQVPGSSAKLLEDRGDPNRRAYLVRFADREGREFINRFWRKYRGKNSQDMMEALLGEVRPTPKRLAAVYRYVEPEASPAQFSEFLEARLKNFESYDDEDVQKLYDGYGPDRYSLSDRGYIARIHPLELWLVNYLRHHPGATYDQVIKASADERVAVYDWLFKTSRKNAQDKRIRGLLEVEAFLEMHKDWKKLGYPFDSLVPSYATAIGSSADRPAALAELMGIIVNNGARLPPVSVRELHFAAGTPYETLLRRAPLAGEQLLKPEVTEVVRRALINVAERGTAKRLNRALVQEDGTVVPIGGKTGTGDHRYDTYGKHGQLLSSRVVNRSAVFAFFIGDRFFGTITAFVPGKEAANYVFTSGLPVQLLKHLLPTLKPLIEAPSEGAGSGGACLPSGSPKTTLVKQETSHTVAR